MQPILGILAGRGQYPALLARRIQNKKRNVLVAGLAGQYTPNSIPGALAEQIFPLGAFRAVMNFFKDNGVFNVFMAGGVYRKDAWRHARPDLDALSLVPKAILGGDDNLLRIVADKFAKAGISIDDPYEYLKDDFAQSGLMAGSEPSDQVLSNLSLAWDASINNGRKDAGQAAIAYKEHVCGLEGRSGTDALLSRAPGPGAVFAKTVKPQQDRRFDMPTVGPSTGIIAAMVGLSAIILESNGVLLLGKERLLTICNTNNVTLLGR